MTRNIRLLIAYDGTNYCGWQRQSKDPTIQGQIEERLSVMTGDPVTLHGAGRTDAGVHALGMVANFQTTAAIPCHGIAAGLNSMLPVDIRILAADEAAADFHSRYSATGKTYCYDFSTAPIQLPVHRLYQAHFPGNFSPVPVRESLAHIRGTHDFSSFEASGSRDTGSDNGRGGTRTLYECALLPCDPAEDAWRFRLTGDGFLRHMVRNLAGTLLEIGRGKLAAEDLRDILSQRDRSAAGPTAPACGLTLEQVCYAPFPEMS